MVFVFVVKMFVLSRYGGDLWCAGGGWFMENLCCVVDSMRLHQTVKNMNSNHSPRKRQMFKYIKRKPKNRPPRSGERAMVEY